MIDIKKINNLDKSEFLSNFGNVFEKSKWISEKVFDRKPFKNLESFFSEIIEIYENSDYKTIFEIFNLHPELVVEKKLTANSEAEQKEANLKLLANPNNVEARWTLSLLKILSNRPREADMHLEILEDLIPSNPWPSAYRGIVNLASWNPWKASLVLEKANKRHQNNFLKGLGDISAVSSGSFWRLTSAFYSVPEAIKYVDKSLELIEK